jgi:hypothetical protein
MLGIIKLACLMQQFSDEVLKERGTHLKAQLQRLVP